MEVHFFVTTALAAIILVSEVSCGPSTATPPQPLTRIEPICFEMLGCIVTSDEWYSIKRPINPNPLSRDEIGTTFKLYTRQNDASGETLRVPVDRRIESRVFDPKKETKFIIHGFKGSAEIDWAVDMRHLLLKYLDSNVIVVDWSKGASTAYPQAASNTRVVGLEVANMVNALIRIYIPSSINDTCMILQGTFFTSQGSKGASTSSFHLIGHSLGAHTAGYAGEKIAGLGRITGLDPAGPLFNKLPTFVRLDPSDAEFVDVIHTDAELLGYGIEDISGHVDFFPNGGSRQPGATVPGIPRAFISEETLEENDLGSSHRRSVQLFLDSINASTTLSGYQRNGGQAVNSCPLIGFLCDSYESFLEGNCTSCGEDGTECALMGIHADSYSFGGRNSSEPHKFYLNTNSKSPFCGYHYAFKLTLANGYAGPDQVLGDLTATVAGDQGVANDMPLTKRGPRNMKKGGTYNFLGYSPLNAGNIESAVVTWEWSPTFLTKLSCLLGCDTNLYVSHLDVTNYGNPPSKRSLKPDGRGITEIKNGKSSVLNFV